MRNHVDFRMVQQFAERLADTDEREGRPNNSSQSAGLRGTARLVPSKVKLIFQSAMPS
jgi:hypothetical protein